MKIPVRKFLIKILKDLLLLFLAALVFVIIVYTMLWIVIVGMDSVSRDETASMRAYRSNMQQEYLARKGVL